MMAVRNMNQLKLREIQNILPAEVTLIAVSKKHSKAEIDEAYRCGCRIFAESRVQELKEKYDPAYEWHMIGHLQRNKVKDVVGLVTMIQSLDSLALAMEIEKQCAKREIIMPVLIEVNIAEESTKSGLTPEDALRLIAECADLPHVDVQGLMCIGPHDDDVKHITECFTKMHALYLEAQHRFTAEKIRILSMGMSDDYPLALACGSNMIRLGRIIMGKR